MLEEGLTPTSVKHGLNRQQKSVNQLGATFKPKTVAVLTAKTDPKNPMAGKLVGGCEESEELEDEAINNEIQPGKDCNTIASEGKEVSEDVLEKVKRSFTDFIKHVEDEIKDSDIKEKKKEDSDLKTKNKQDRDLITKEDDSELASALSGVVPAQQPAGEPGVSVKESAPVKTITNECGLWEVHGNERDGFEIRRSGRCLPSRFKNLDEAQLALEMFAHRMRKQDESQDYMEER